MSGYTEDHLVEQPAIQLMQHRLGWEVAETNDFLLGSQFWVAGEFYLKRDDIIVLTDEAHRSQYDTHGADMPTRNGRARCSAIT